MYKCQVRKQTSMQEGIGPCQPCHQYFCGSLVQCECSNPWPVVCTAEMELRNPNSSCRAVKVLWGCSFQPFVSLPWLTLHPDGCLLPSLRPLQLRKSLNSWFPKAERAQGRALSCFLSFCQNTYFFTIAIILRMLLFLRSLYSEVELPCVYSKYCFIYLLGFAEAEFGFIPLF